jgi:SAM-dependent methyltransferase
MKAVIQGIRPRLKSMLPKPVLDRISMVLSRRWDAKFEGKPSVDVFSAVYNESKWGRQSGTDFYSGSGSHRSDLVLPYVNAASAFLSSLPERPSVADLGCGDFNIGRQLRQYCGRYVACDLVPELIERNVTTFSDLGVEFKCLDIAQDDLPDAEVVFLRQVLQHLDNNKILAVVQQLYRYQFIIVTEHLPAQATFLANKDKRTGSMIRLFSDSGVVLTEAPFNLRVKAETVLCSVPEALDRRPGIIKTTLYEL